MNFNTAGSMGDSIYQTLFILELSEALNQSIEVNIQYGKKGYYSQKHPYGDLQLTKDAAEFLAPLFIQQGWLTTVSDKKPSPCIDIDTFRTLRLNFSSFDIRLWCYNLVKQILPMDLSRATIEVSPDTTFRDKILLAKTSRYNNYFMDYNVLKPYAKDIVMMGLEEEWKDFCNRYFKVDFCKVHDAYEAAKYIAGAKLMVANQCGLYSIAEQMKTPRVLCTAEYITIKHPNTGVDITVPGPCNVIPQGGRCAMAGTTAKLEAAMKEFNA